MLEIRRHCRDLLVILCLVLFGTQLFIAASKDLTTWWPDPSTGLMWAGQTPSKMSWQESKDYCASLQLGGYSGWRLPTLDEVKAITSYRRTDYPESRHYAGYSITTSEFKGVDSIPTIYIWTSTSNGDDKASVVGHGPVWPTIGSIHLSGRVLGRFVATPLCTRPMEPDLLQIAKDAQPNRPVPDVLTLKAYIPLNKARQSYQAGQYQESINQAKNALLVKPDFVPAYWAIGISYGRSGQWDLAITNLETALKIDKDYGDAKDALKWATESQKAAKSGGRIKALDPQWN